MVLEARFKWVAANATDCEGPDVNGDAEGGEMVYDYEAGLMVGQFTFADVTEEKYKLCYAFSGKKWVFVSLQSEGDVYPPITAESRGLLSLTDLSGKDFLQILPNVPTQWMAVVANAKPGDRMRLVSGIRCDVRAEVVAEAAVDGYMVEWNVETVLPEVHVCYGYSNEDSVELEDHFWVMYDQYPVDVMYVSGVSSLGNKHIAVVGVPKTYEFAGSHIEALDTVFFVPVDARCDNATSVVEAPVGERARRWCCSRSRWRRR